VTPAGRGPAASATLYSIEPLAAGAPDHAPLMFWGRLAGLAAQQGVPASVIVTEMQARDTFENVRYCRAIMQARGWRDAIVVTTPYHVRRASYIFRLAGLPHQMAYPVCSYELASWHARCRALRWDLLGLGWLLAAQMFGVDPSWWAERRSRRSPAR
jgi:uncharacterized SAM-binding protein YcdF (DUF218 family)